MQRRSDRRSMCGLGLTRSKARWAAPMRNIASDSVSFSDVPATLPYLSMTRVAAAFGASFPSAKAFQKMKQKK